MATQFFLFLFSMFCFEMRCLSMAMSLANLPVSYKILIYTQNHLRDSESISFKSINRSIFVKIFIFKSRRKYEIFKIGHSSVTLEIYELIYTARFSRKFLINYFGWVRRGISHVTFRHHELRRSLVAQEN